VTCIGEVFVGRVAASVLLTIGLPELITTTLADYEALALKLATQPALLQSVRDKLKQNRQTSALFDTQRFCRHMEAAYATMWAIWKQGEAPRNFTVNAVEG
jgi:predicted O-linked N-acetylglucosamine transferase (SPINDLY family)